MNELYFTRKLTLAPGKRLQFDSGADFAFLLMLSGECRACLGGAETPCTDTDMLLLKPQQTCTLITEGLEEPCTLSVLQATEQALVSCSDAECNLLEKYNFAPYPAAVVHGDVSVVLTLKNLISRLRSLPQEQLRLGIGIYENGLLAIFLVLFLRACVQSDRVRRQRMQQRLLIDDVFLYIREHLTEELSIPRLEQEFYVSGEHLTRKFRATAGISVHSYIVKSRIDLSKRLIAQGSPIKEVYARCGFGSYNHFFRAFKKECRMTPREYYKQVNEPAR